MHPVLANVIQPLAQEIAKVNLLEAQTSPDPKFNRWCGQEVVEHLILSFQKSRDELHYRVKSKELHSTSATFLQRVIKFQVCWFGSMSNGVSTLPSLMPVDCVPQDGPALAARLLAEAEELSKVLTQCRLNFGMQPCGYHYMCGPLRVEEWRTYHAVHCRHHLRQFKEAIDFARKQRSDMRKPKLGIEHMASEAGHDE